MQTTRFPQTLLCLLCMCLLLVSCSLAAGPMGTNATTSRAVSSAMFGIDAEHTHFTSDEHIITYANVSRLVLDWTSFATGGSIFSSPVVVGGVVFIGSLDGRLYAFSAAGCRRSPCQPLWASTSTGDRIFSSPAVANGVVYIGSYDHRLYAFNADGCGKATCAPLWASTPMGSYIDSSPTVADGMVYIGSEDGKLYVFKAGGCGKAACSPVWTSLSTKGFMQSSPAVAGGRVFVGSFDNMANGTLYAFNAHGCEEAAHTAAVRETGGIDTLSVDAKTLLQVVEYVAHEENVIDAIINGAGTGPERPAAIPIEQPLGIDRYEALLFR